MESLLTQGLIGLVFVLSIALYSKSGTGTSPSTTASSASGAKKSKKKKKGVSSSAVTKDDAVATAIRVTSDAPSAPEVVRSEDRDQKQNETKASYSEKLIDQTGNDNKKSRKSNAKKMTFEDFAAKTNEERVEELERRARGDAGDKDVGSDMIDKGLQSEIPYKKVARIESSAPKVVPKRAPLDEGWESVGGRIKSVPASSAGGKLADSPPPNAWASSNPFALLPGSGAEVIRPVYKSNGSSSSKPALASSVTPNSTRSIPGAGEAQTKKQRQNAAKAQAKKLEKDAAETERMARLAQHKKQVEAERMKEFFKKQNNQSAPFSVHKGASNGAGMAKASINEKGSLVWD